MQIDWFTVAAQVVNFLILVFLLKRFLYRPVVDAMAARAARERERFSEAEEREKLAEREADALKSERERLREREVEILEAAKSEASATKAELIESARSEVSDLRARWQGELEREQDEVGRSLREACAHEVVATARQLVHDLSHRSLEGPVVETFIEQLATLDPDDAADLSKDAASIPARVVASFALADGMKDELVRAVRAKVTGCEDIRFEQSDDLAFGIELILGGRKVRWAADDYLAGIEQRIRNAADGRPSGGEVAHARE